MRVLITGVAGFVGKHLLNHLGATLPDAEFHGTVIAPTLPFTNTIAIHLHTVNLQDEHAMKTLIREICPDRIFHLAATAMVHRSFDTAWETLENNIRAQLNLTLACIAAEIAPRMLIVSSGEVYGAEQSPDVPTREDAPMRPANPYAVSKVAQDFLGLQYFLSHQLPIMRARPFNHLGPGQSTGFVAPDLSLQIARVEAGLQEPVITCGDLSAERDFTDVRDIVRAYALIAERGTAGEAYNIATGWTYPIRHVLNTLLSFSSEQIDVRSQTTRIHSSGVRRSWGDSTRLRQATGWQPTIPLNETLLDVLNDYRQRVQAELAGARAS